MIILRQKFSECVLVLQSPIKGSGHVFCLIKVASRYRMSQLWRLHVVRAIVHRVAFPIGRNHVVIIVDIWSLGEEIIFLGVIHLILRPVLLTQCLTETV